MKYHFFFAIVRSAVVCPCFFPAMVDGLPWRSYLGWLGGSLRSPRVTPSPLAPTISSDLPIFFPGDSRWGLCDDRIFAHDHTIKSPNFFPIILSEMTCKNFFLAIVGRRWVVIVFFFAHVYTTKYHFFFPIILSAVICQNFFRRLYLAFRGDRTSEVVWWSYLGDKGGLAALAPDYPQVGE